MAQPGADRIGHSSAVCPEAHWALADSWLGRGLEWGGSSLEETDRM